jgi:hypothetical protein
MDGEKRHAEGDRRGNASRHCLCGRHFVSRSDISISFNDHLYPTDVKRAFRERILVLGNPTPKNGFCNNNWVLSRWGI